jgi:signal transduction histidine kinase
VQEALTNTARYAGRGATVKVDLEYGPERVALSVIDADGDHTTAPRRPPEFAPPSEGLGVGSSSALAGFGVSTPSEGPGVGSGTAGSGLAGLAERAALHGGHLEHGPTPDGWRVALTLPVRTEVEAGAR